MSELLPCPCGKIPEMLIVSDAGQGGKWAYVSGNCCSEWELEFRTDYYNLDTKECLDLATERWNEAPRTALNTDKGE